MGVASATVTGRRLLLLALAVVALLGVAWWLEVALPERRQAALDARDLIAPEDAALLSLDLVQRKSGERVEMSLARNDAGGWRLESPSIEGPVSADVRAVEDLERTLLGARLGSLVIAAADIGEDTLGQFGLSPPLVSVKWTVDHDASRTDGAIDLGMLSPSGAPYALAPSGDVVLGPRPLFDVVSRDLALWRIKRVLPAHVPTIQRVELERPRDPPAPISQYLAFERDEAVRSDWRLVERGELVALGNPALPTPGTEPVLEASQDAADVQIESLLSKLRTLQALGFGPEDPSAAELASRDLDPPWARVVLHPLSEGGEEAEPVDLIIGAEAPREGTVWARAGDGPLVMVVETLRSDLLLPDLAFRENRVLPFPTWQVDSLEIDKPGRLESLHLLIERQGESERARWSFTAPVEAALSAQEAATLLRRLEDVRIGRFEDEHAADPEQHLHGDFDGLGTFRLDLHATTPDGRPRSSSVRVGPPYRGPGGDLFSLVALEDERGHRSLGVVEASAFDRFLEEARALRDAAWERASAEP